MFSESTLIELGSKGLLLLIAALVLATLFRRRSAAWRHAVWLSAILGLIGLSLATVGGPAWSVPISDHSQFAPLAREVEPSVTTDKSPLPPVAATESASTPSFEGIAITIYEVIACLLLFRTLVGLLAAARLVRRSVPISVDTIRDLPQDVRLLQSDRVRIPATAGVFRPAILVPPDAQQWPTERLNMVVAHELAHIQRRDWLWSLFAQVTCAVYWFNPLVWFATARLRSESELACDDLVLSRGFDPDRYANVLLTIAKSARPQVATVLGMAHKPQVADRLRSIVDPKRKRTAVRKRILFSCIVLSLITCVFVAAIKPVLAQSQSPTPNQPEDTKVAIGTPNQPGWHGPLQVTVIDRQGRPLPNAHVMFQLSRPMIMGILAPPDGLTNSKGVYLATPASFAEDEKRVGSDSKWEDIDAAVAYIPGLQPEIAFIKKGQRETTIRLASRGIALRARVQHADGTPAIGAELSVRDFVPTDTTQTTLSIPKPWRPMFTAKVDAKGNAQFLDVPHGYRVEFDTWDPRYVRLPWYHARNIQADTLNDPVVLTRAGVLEGTITKGGKPLPNIWMQASHPTNDTLNWAKTGTSDESGRYRITGVAPGTYSIRVADPYRLESTRNQAISSIQNVEVVEGAHITGLDFQVAPGAVITGHLRFADGTTPPAYWEVGCDRAPDPKDGSQNGRARIDENGNFQMHIPAGKHSIYVFTISDPRVAPSKTVDVKDGDRVAVDFVVPKTW